MKNYSEIYSNVKLIWVSKWTGLLLFLYSILYPVKGNTTSQLYICRTISIQKWHIASSPSKHFICVYLWMLLFKFRLITSMIKSQSAAYSPNGFFFTLRIQKFVLCETWCNHYWLYKNQYLNLLENLKKYYSFLNPQYLETKSYDNLCLIQWLFWNS